ncbi:MAG TPA: circularly permuted type 2 ATP-grasp protein [Vicinamibacterales bacterium]|nr:circularly permuted type 2 ATP-grasp protein [Vicinamibacterales bacterium]
MPQPPANTDRPTRRRGDTQAALLSGYAAPGGHFDELLDASGRPRAWWTAFSGHAGDLTGDTLTTAQARVARQIHESSITHTVFAAAEGRSRPWTLDVLPFILSAAEWRPLARGLRQQARLLNAIAADLYGDQRLVKEGLIPPALVFGHRGFHRACHGVRPPGGLYLHQVAFDLARGADGHWRVANVRAQLAAGAGFALENRATILRMFPDAFRELQVQAVAPYFATLRETLVSTAPCDERSPHIVLLTPGPYSGRYFEHAYLARYFGFPLVEGADLTVRHDRVFLKTIAGLRQVHGILRHLNDDFCDPLEMRADSALGVPGLVGAWRAGRVLVANAFGTGVLESPALRGLLPLLSERLLGEPLATPAINTWWCGDQAALDEAEAVVSAGSVRPALSADQVEPPSFRSVQGLRDLLAAGDLEGSVIEEPLALSHAPVWHDGRLESRALMLRVFAVADGRGDYTLMPGGLTRIADRDRTTVSKGSGGSKDTWVLSNAPLGPRPVDQRRAPAAEEIHGDRAVSSRAAEHLFWLGRYVERAETCTRLLRTALTRLSDASTPGVSQPSFVRACLAQGLFDPSDLETSIVSADPSLAMDPVSASALIHKLIDNLFDAQGRRSVGFNVRQAIRVAGAIRDRLSSDNWRLLNQLFEMVGSPPESDVDLHDALAIIDRAIIALGAVAGLEMAHMTRDHGWRFLSVGRHLERLLSIATTFEALGPEDAADPELLEWLLDVSDSLVTFRARYVRTPEWPAVVELLLFDAYNPRSLAFQVGKVARHVPQLPGSSALPILADLARLEHLCQTVDPRQPDLFAGQTWLENLLRDSQTVALKVSDALTSRYFSHAYELPHATKAGR